MVDIFRQGYYYHSCSWLLSDTGKFNFKSVRGGKLYWLGEQPAAFQKKEKRRKPEPSPRYKKGWISQLDKRDDILQNRPQILDNCLLYFLCFIGFVYRNRFILHYQFLDRIIPDYQFHNFRDLECPNGLVSYP